MSRRGPGARTAGVGALVAFALMQPAPAVAAGPAPRQLTVLSAGQLVARVHLRYRGSSTVGLVAANAVSIAVAPGERTVVSAEGVPSDLAGSLPRGAKVGRAVIRNGGRELASVPLVTQRAIVAATLGQRLRDFLSRSLTILALGVLLGCSLLLAILRARATRRNPAGHERTQGSQTAA